MVKYSKVQLLLLKMNVNKNGSIPFKLTFFRIVKQRNISKFKYFVAKNCKKMLILNIFKIMSKMYYCLFKAILLKYAIIMRDSLFSLQERYGLFE